MPKKVSLAKLDLSVIQKEIKRRMKVYKKLCAQRAKLDEKIAEFEALAPLAGKFGKKRGRKRGRKPGRRRRGPGRPKMKAGKKGKRARRNPAPLAELLYNNMKGKDKVSIPEAAKLAIGAGYKTKAKNFDLVVGVAFKNKKLFKKVARGVYTVKG
ncbi:MAG: hypothetical protein HZA50_09735 [Planctomycetes bacterium]|nr:hypothetical protein [Planctomycetota bacterium]